MLYGQIYCRERGYKFTSSYCTHWDEFGVALTRKFLGPLTDRFKKRICKTVNFPLAAFHNRASRLLIASEKLGTELRERGINTDIHVIGRGADAGQR
jgi:hypothetical protein